MPATVAPAVSPLSAAPGLDDQPSASPSVPSPDSSTWDQMRGFTRRIWPRPPVKPPRDYDEDEPATPPVPPARSISDNSAAGCNEPGGRATGPTRASSQIARNVTNESDDSKCYALANTPDDLAHYDNEKDQDG